MVCDGGYPWCSCCRSYLSVSNCAAFPCVPVHSIDNSKKLVLRPGPGTLAKPPYSYCKRKTALSDCRNIISLGHFTFDIFFAFAFPGIAAVAVFHFFHTQLECVCVCVWYEWYWKGYINTRTKYVDIPSNPPTSAAAKTVRSYNQNSRSFIIHHNRCTRSRELISSSAAAIM